MDLPVCGIATTIFPSLRVVTDCLVGDKIMEVEIDGKTGKVTEMEEAKALPAHKEHAHDEAPEEKDEDKEED